MRLDSTKVRWLRHPVLVLWFFYVALIPIYVGGSGLPQPSNLLLVIILALVIPRWNGRLERHSARTMQALLLMTAWICVVNYAWAGITGHYSLSAYVIFPFYYVFNALVLFLALLLYRAHSADFLRATLGAVFCAILYQFAASFVYRSELYRGTLFFNNPNQLGYWALLASCLVSLLNGPLKVGKIASGLAITGCAYLAILSASRAALAGIGILIVLLVFSNPKLIIVGVIAAIAMMNVGGPLSDALEESERRAAGDQGRNGSFVEERGYDRLWEHKEYLLLGAGEGDLERFSTEDRAVHEIHSSAATVLFSYGIIGALLFLVFIARVLAGSPLPRALLMVPTLAYTIAHQGLRFSMLWLLIAIFVALKSPIALSANRNVMAKAPRAA